MTTDRDGWIRLSRTAVAAVVLVWTGAWAFYYMFSRFAWYDDEGYLMLSVQRLAQGGRLYDDVFSQYGPFYYVVRLALTSVLGLPITHDATRIVSLAAWMLSAGLLSICVWLLSRSFIAALVAYLLIFRHLAPFGHEPGHPQELVVLLLGGIVALGARWNTPRTLGRLSVAGGLLTGALALTKVNVGAFSLVALVATGAVFANGHRGTFVPTMVVATALPWIVMREHVGSWAFGYAAVVSLGLLAIAIGMTRPSERPVRSAPLTWFAISAALMAAASCGVVLALGTSVNSLFRGIVLDPLAFARLVSTEVRVSIAALAVTVVSLLLAAIHRRRHELARMRHTERRDWTFWWVKTVGASIGIVLAIQSPRALLIVGPSLLWLTLAKPIGPGWSFDEHMPRVLLVLLASLQSLQAYPMAGSQVAWATLLMIPAFIVSLMDAFVALTQLGAAGNLVARRTVRLHVVAMAGLAMLLVLPRMDLVAARDLYRQSTPLAFPGALQIRLSQKEVARYEWLVSRIQEQCSTFIGLPGFNSLYFWSRLDPPTGLNATAWQVLFDRERQQMIVDAITPQPWICVVEYPAGIRTYGHEEAADALPLMRFIRDRFTLLEEREGYRILVRRDRLQLVTDRSATSTGGAGRIRAQKLLEIQKVRE